MQTIINKLNNLKNTAIDNFELNTIDKCILEINKGKIDNLKKEIQFEIDNYQHYINYMFFTELKKAINN
tara:strand:+ start:143 stop:349 length:207 start_codon:yes stop_codon:yes gene_type:complete